MSSEWQVKTIGEFCPFKYGKGLPERDRKPGGFDVFSSAGLVGTHESAYVNSPGVVIGRKGTVGSVTYSAAPFWPIDTAFYVEDQPAIRDIRFTYYLLRTLGLHLMNTDSAVPGLNRDNAHAVEVAVPSLNSQRTIADFLEHLDDRIILLRETNATLEAIAQALFKSWFVDFDPVHAKQEGRAAEDMDGAIAALFPDSFEESELGLVPKGWVVKRLSDVLKAKNERVEQLNVPEYASTNEGLIPRAKIYKKQLAASSSKNKLIKRGDLIFGLSRQVLNFGQMQDEIGSVSSAYKIYQVDAHEVIPELLGRLIRTRSDYFFNAVSASSREGQSVSSEALGVLYFVQPPIVVQNILWQTMQPLLMRGTWCLQQAETLSEIRDTLLPRLISGQLRVNEIGYEN